MTLVQLEALLAARLGMDPKDTSRVLRAALTVVVETLAAGEEVKLAGFGKFETRERPARRRKDPRNGRDLDIPARRGPVFRASRLLAARIDKAD